MTVPNQPLVIIGAPRSGTNLLRDILTRFEHMTTWPCDEINYIWRYGNAAHETDRFTPDMARPEVVAYIRSRFEQLAAGKHYAYLVEKTCANSLRVGFVDRVLPQARYLFIVRDGLDAVNSAMKRWKAPLEPMYLARKARYVPLRDMPHYASRYFSNRLHKLFSNEDRLALWGPAIPDLKKLLQQYTLTQCCALQWQACVELAAQDLEQIDASRWHSLRYEELVSEPQHCLARICEFLHCEPDPAALQYINEEVSQSSVGLGRNSLSAQDLDAVLPLIGSTLKQYGYEH